MKKFYALNLLLIAMLLSCFSVQAKREKAYQLGKLDDIKIEETITRNYNAATNVWVDGGTFDNESFDFSVDSYEDEDVDIDRTYVFFVRVGDIGYVATYKPLWPWSYKPAFIVGDQVQVRLNNKQDRIFLKRPDGKDMKAKIMKATRLHSTLAHNPGSN